MDHYNYLFAYYIIGGHSLHIISCLSPSVTWDLTILSVNLVACSFSLLLQSTAPSISEESQNGILLQVAQFPEGAQQVCLFDRTVLSLECTRTPIRLSGCGLYVQAKFDPNGQFMSQHLRIFIASSSEH